MIDKLIEIERRVQTIRANEWTNIAKNRVIQEFVYHFQDVDQDVAYNDLMTWWDWADDAVQLDPARRVESVIDGERKMLIAKYNGRFVTRLKKWYRLNGGSNMTDASWSLVGNIYMQQRPVEETIFFDVTRGPFDWCDGDFGDSGSCYWGGRAICRDILMDHHAWAVRTWDDAERNPELSYEGGNGRAWLIPWQYEDRPALILYNGYRSIEGRNGVHDENISEWFARWFSSWLGAQWRRTGLSNNNRTSETFYINSGSGYLISTDMPLWVDDIDLGWREPSRRCCSYCNERYNQNEADRTCFTVTANGRRVTRNLCHDCYERHARRCDICNRLWMNGDLDMEGGMRVCPMCIGQAPRCDGCGIRNRAQYMTSVGTLHYCRSCADQLLSACSRCGETHFTTEMHHVIGARLVCDTCHASGDWRCVCCGREFISRSWAIEAGLCLDCYVDREVGNG